MAGIRKNEGKPRMDLLPWDVLKEVAAYMGDNVEGPNAKYPERNWEQGLKTSSQLLASLMRHTADFAEGKDVSDVSPNGFTYHETIAIATNALMLAALCIRGAAIDDRRKSVAREEAAIDFSESLERSINKKMSAALIVDKGPVR